MHTQGETDQYPMRVPGKDTNNHYHVQNRVLRLQQELEECRGYAANQICDGMVNFLGTLSIELADVQRFFPRERRLLERLAALNKLIDPVSETLRHIRGRFRPAILDQQGLVAAIGDTTADLARRTGVTVHPDLSFLDLSFSRCFELAVFRVLEEALSNIERHSGAGEVGVFYGLTGQRSMVLEVEDDGVGIERGAVDDQASTGLFRMREQAALIGGVVGIAAVDSGGTRVRLSIPEAQWTRAAVATGFTCSGDKARCD